MVVFKKGILVYGEQDIYRRDFSGALCLTFLREQYNSLGNMYITPSLLPIAGKYTDFSSASLLDKWIKRV